MTNLDELRDQQRENTAERRAFVKQWAEFVRTHPDEEWSAQQNKLINSQVRQQSAMAQSHDGSIIDDDRLNVSFNRDDLPEGETQLVIHEDGVTTVIQDNAEKVEQRFKEQRANDLDMIVEEYEATIEGYSMPDPLDDETTT